MSAEDIVLRGASELSLDLLIDSDKNWDEYIVLVRGDYIDELSPSPTVVREFTEEMLQHLRRQILQLRQNQNV
jgi:hypothetical protein